MKLNKLTPEEEQVIVHKGTEPPFSGEYDKFFEEGIYVCRRCDTPLYKSEDKFDAKCGWPSFDREIGRAVKRLPDPDGKRTEIICAACQAHLGHVFTGENFTPQNTRHCVNSISLRFVPKAELETAVFGSGCFWCTDAVFRRLRGVVQVDSGFAGGRKKNPTDEDIISGEAGFAEVVKIDYYPKVISYEDLLNIFFYIHDPTSLNRQGNDIGERYRSIILYLNEFQKKTAEKFIAKLTASRAYDKPIITELKSLDKFYKATVEHQDYYEKNPEKPYCQIVIAPKIKKLEEKFKEFLTYA